MIENLQVMVVLTAWCKKQNIYYVLQCYFLHMATPQKELSIVRTLQTSANHTRTLKWRLSETDDSKGPN